ncbi:MAG: DUF3883 domain-containing protein [Bacteroidota bacterium]
MYESLADYFALSDEAREEIIMDNGRSRSKWNNVVRWTREDLKSAGMLSAPRHGVWEITVKGQALLKDAEVDVAASAGGPRRGIDLDTFLSRKKEAERIGRLGEEHVLAAERTRLSDSGRQDLAGRVEHVALTDVGAGYDILSFELNGSPRYIEVKATRSDRSGFEITANEIETAAVLGQTYWLYRVSRIESGQPQVVRYSDVAALIESGRLRLRPVAFRATWTELQDVD